MTFTVRSAIAASTLLLLPALALADTRAAKAADMVRPSVVRVNGFGETAALKKPKRAHRNVPPAPAPAKPAKPDAEDKAASDELEQISIGSGVVIVDDGTILTNLHVVYGVKRVTVTFAPRALLAAVTTSVTVILGSRMDGWSGSTTCE